MITGLSSVNYKVSDVQAAKDWYSEVLNSKPILETSFYIIFLVGDNALVLTPLQDDDPEGSNQIVAFWRTDDIDAEYSRLLELGATAHTEVMPTTGGMVAVVIDPFGNALGISSRRVASKESSVEQQPSETAIGAATMRAIMYHEEREEMKGNDYLAEIFIRDDVKSLLGSPAIIRSVIHDRMPGVYEVLNARTAFFDEILEKALRNDIAQIVFLGAGYDTRPYRFKDLIQHTQLFELDIHTTQNRKLELLQKHNVSIPKELTHVAINFNTATLEEALVNAGYKRDQNNLFVWEGVTYYLDESTVDATFDFIRSSSSLGSCVCFDYSARWPEMMQGYGVRKSIETMMRDHSGESVGGFGIDEGKLESFLAERGFKIVEYLDTEAIEQRFLTLHDGTLAGKANALFRFVHASAAE